MFFKDRKYQLGVHPYTKGRERLQILKPIGTVARGLGVDEYTAVILPLNDRAKVVGKGYAYFLNARNAPQVCKLFDPKPVPLTYQTVKGFRIWGRTNGNWVDFQKSKTANRWDGSGGDPIQMSVNKGNLTITGYHWMPKIH
jgi:hypothetical protein